MDVVVITGTDTFQGGPISPRDSTVDVVVITGTDIFSKSLVSPYIAKQVVFNSYNAELFSLKPWGQFLCNFKSS